MKLPACARTKLSGVAEELALREARVRSNLVFELAVEH